MNKKLIVANWKNHPKSLAQAQEILDFTNDYLESLDETQEFGLVFCPPFIFIEEVAKILQISHFEHEAFLGAQDIEIEDTSVFTGLVEGSRPGRGSNETGDVLKPGINVEISGPMLRKLGICYVIIGHSERRWKLGESDAMVNKKLKATLRNEMIPIVCIGERTRAGNFKKFLEDQVASTFKGLSADEIGKCIIAYEPVWAISTNPGARPDTPQSALKSIKIIRNFIIGNWKLKIEHSPKALYGGSVKSKNARGFLKEKEINGVLIGGASVNKEEFVKILEITSRI